jgi:fructosamine-3-kinase
MTEAIQKSIDQIHSKTKALLQVLHDEREKNGLLNLEIERVNKLLEDKNNECLLIKTDLETVQAALHLAENKVIEEPAQLIGKNEQDIDELVKDIEFCIEQLKK